MVTFSIHPSLGKRIKLGPFHVENVRTLKVAEIEIANGSFNAIQPTVLFIPMEKIPSLRARGKNPG
jgi:hypothetical protein